LVSSTTDHAPQQQFDSSTYDSSYVSTGQRPRYDSNQLLMLPAPLGANRTPATATTASTSTTMLNSRSSEEGGYTSDVGSQQRLVPSPPQDSYYPEEYDSPPVTRYASPPPVSPSSPFEARVSRTAGMNSGVLRQGTGHQYPAVETQYPYSYQGGSGYDQPSVPFYSEPEALPGIPASPPPIAPNNRTRGISLADTGPVPGPEGVRRVSRQPNKRPTSQAPPQNRYSRSSPSPYTNLPAGAAPPQPGYGY